ncbi:MAG: hypothetical protein H0V31_00805 [Acidobacteria bacterium]|nr:hypothetical protein [Acidobacteriota bacterium]
MKMLKFALLFLLIVGCAVPVWLYMSADNRYESEALNNEETDDPDLPPGAKIEKGDYLMMRAEQIGLLRGFDTARPESRSKAVKKWNCSKEKLLLSDPANKNNRLR